MSIENPLTTSNAIARVTPPTLSPPIKLNPLKPDLGIFADDILDISQQGLNKQQSESHIQASKDIEQLANEVVRVSSTIGRARSLGNLSTKQALALYNQIASLL